MLTDDERFLITEILRQKPFESDHVFFFGLQGGKPLPLDDLSRRLYERDNEIVDALPDCEPLEDWAGNILNGPRDNARAYFYASYRFEEMMIVVSKIIAIPSGAEHVESPFNKYFVDAIAASIAPILGRIGAHQILPGGRKLPAGKRLIPFVELVAWRECKHLWRETFGPNVWIAVKGTQPVATANSVEELERKVRSVEPPLLYVPPKGMEEECDVISASLTGMKTADFAL